MSLTKAQNAAINENGKTILVSAAAGSGKTFTLTQRIIKKIIGDENGGADLSRMLIVTFTRAAAQELRVKISDALAKAIAENPSNQRLQQQMLALGGAKICTIDSFFTEPVKNNFEKLGLPASLRLADAAELDDAREEIMTNVIEKMYRENGFGKDTRLSGLDTSCDFVDFLTSLSSTKSTNKIIPLLLGIHTSLMSSPDGIITIKKNADRLMSTSECDFFNTLEGKIIKERAVSVATLASEKLDFCIKRMSEDAFIKEKYLAAFEENKTKCHVLAQRAQGTYTEAKEAFEAFAAPKLPPISSKDATPLSVDCKNAKTQINKAISDFYKKYLFRNDGEIKNQIILTAKYNYILFEILSEFDRKYREYKKEKGLCEFYDMPIYLLRLLEDENLTVREEMQKMYDEVYIDEYQDVNEIQDRIFEIIGGNRRFMVGDIKQSIYGFRDAVPELFAAYRNSFPKYDDENAKAGDGCTIFMSENFRCDSTVIDFTNTVCPFLFKATGERLGYTSDDDLKFKKLGLPEEYTPTKAQINIIQSSEKDDEADKETEIEASDIPKEAIICAKEILRLLKQEKKPDGSPILKKDIAVLVRVKDDGPKVARALKLFGIDCCVSAKSEIFDGEDMKALLDLLRVIDNPEDDISLCGFLTSPAYCGSAMFSLEEIVTIRKFTSDSKSLMSALREYGKLADDGDPLATLLCFRASETVKLLSRLRALSRKISPNKLLKEIRVLDEFSLICQTDAYIYLYDTSCNYVKNSWSGLYSFLKYCRKLSDKGSASFAEATPTDAVNIMTVHQSKGLEYNTVFVYNAAHKFSNQDARSSLNYNVELCTATKLPHYTKDDFENKYVDGYVDSIIRDAIILKNRENDVYEEMRVLYVALTRARERLYVSATIKDSFDDFKNKIFMSGFSNLAKKQYNNYISWIISSILDPQNDVRKNSFDINVINKDEIDEYIEPELIDKISKNNNLTDKEIEYIEIMTSAKLNANIPEIPDIPSKIAASKASPDLFDKILIAPQNMLAASESEKTSAAISERLELMKSHSNSLSDLLDKKNSRSAADIGTATHAFLQFCDFGLLHNLGVDSETKRLVEDKFMSKEDSMLINKYQIKQFANSDFFRLVLSCKDIRREFRFGIFTAASNFAEGEELKKSLLNKEVYVQGSIDILMETDNGEIYICDYKTDRPQKDEDIESFKNRLYNTHKHQLQQYKDATIKIYGKAPDKVFIYSLPLGEAVEIKI